MPLTTKQRRENILTDLYAVGHVEVKQLAAAMNISEATVRRDLRSLAEERQLELVYGGATMPRTSDYSIRTKSLRNTEAKRVIGRLAASLVNDDETIFIDGGTTCFEMCPYLKRKRGLSIIVNSVRLATELGTADGQNLIVIGGQYRPDRLDNIGPLALSALDQLRGYIAFIGADGVSMDFGVTASDIDSAHLHKLAIQNARETVLLIDHSKLYVPSLYRITGIESVTRVVTDKRPSQEWLDFFGGRGIKVFFPPEAEAPALPHKQAGTTVPAGLTEIV
jgi:DeoR/GlpR family transcriptional regulator of sugar metabolism